jgi:hypothetical protein
MIAPRLFAIAVHALLHHRPAAIVADNEAMQIKVEAVLNGGAVDFCDQAARLRERLAVEADAIAQRHEFARRQARMAAAADVQAEFAAQRAEAALERPEHARGDAGGMPIHSHQRAKRLEPERMRQAAEEFIASVMMNDRLAEQRPKPRHPLREPFRNAPVVERQVGAAGSSHRPLSRSGLGFRNGYFVPILFQAVSEVNRRRNSRLARHLQFSVRLSSLASSEKAGISMSKCSPLALTMP